jgi:hypothetical protein
MSLVPAMRGNAGLGEFIGQMRSKQTNTLWPQTVANPRLAAIFLLRGSPDRRPTQGAAARIPGLTLFGEGLETWPAGHPLPPIRLVGVALALPEAWAFHNGSPRGDS